MKMETKTKEVLPRWNIILKKLDFETIYAQNNLHNNFAEAVKRFAFLISILRTTIRINWLQK